LLLRAFAVGEGSGDGEEEGNMAGEGEVAEGFGGDAEGVTWR
jgi:hypothetical protein